MRTKYQRTAPQAPQRRSVRHLVTALFLMAAGGFVEPAMAADFRITSATRDGQVEWTNAFLAGVCTIDAATTVTNQWRHLQNCFTTNSVGAAMLPVNASNHFFRLLAVDVSTNTPFGYTNLLRSYGNLHTIAGKGTGGTDGSNYWHSSFEGGYATNAALSRPHMAMADDAGNVFIADKDSHSVLKVTPDGRIHTVAGTHVAGNGPNVPTHATNVALNQPTGLWVRGDGLFYILDSLNHKVRRVDTNGMMSTFLTVPTGLAISRGLWVEDDETDAYICAGTTLVAWRATNGFTVLNTNFIDLGNIHVTPTKENVWATDRGDNIVWKVDTGGKGLGQRTQVYGDGHNHALVDGTSAVTNSLSGVRGIWKFPTDGYLLAMHEGDHLVYVDPADIAHIFVPGQTGMHTGDGQWFHTPGAKISQCRSVTMDQQGNILIVENDFGYVRRIDFQRLPP